jgi:hypothetical protein
MPLGVDTIIRDLSAVEGLVAQGWCQGGMERYCPDREGRMRMHYCLLGAINRVAATSMTATSYAHMTHLLVQAIIQRNLPQRGIMSWNDAKGRTVEEVIALVRQVRTELESKKAST